LYGGKYPFVQTGDIKASGGRITSFEQTYSEAGLAQSRLWPAGTLAITIAATIAETGILAFPACFPDSVVGFLADDTKCDIYFIEFMFRYLRQKIQSEASGSVQDNINLETLNNLSFPLPPLPEQRAIARILGALDDKIELNRCMNHTLESMAQALFKSWFVDYDPATAKAEGRAPFGMSAETAALFPAEFTNTKIGSIPFGWVVDKVSAICTTQYGFTTSATDEPIGSKFLRITDINKNPWIEWGNVPYCKVSEINKAKYQLGIGDVLVSRMADPGKAGIVEQEIDAVFASYLVRLKAKNLAWSYFLFYFLRSDQYLDYADGVMSGSVQLGMNAKVIVDADMILPPESLVNRFFQQVYPLRKKIVSNLKESNTLANIRDMLLPRLLSGELRVKA
jgi:type I restriction enzyme S subunit